MDGGMDNCCICCDVVKNRVEVDACRHTFCRTCLLNWLQFERKKYSRMSCPVCRTKIQKFRRVKEIIWEHSTNFRKPDVRNPGTFAYRRARQLPVTASNICK
ncbi:hypothetical protein M758_3G092800 [Ceratodon purpureus]|nr:hypothetical protein M758_3G092800 [Ceratodon purpureus]